MSDIPDVIRKQVRLRAPLERVWKALTDSSEFGRWFGVRFDAPFKPGAKMTGTIVPTTVDPAVAAQQKPYEGKTFEITIDRIEPQRLFSFRWHPYAADEHVDYAAEPTTLVVFELQPEKDGVLLTVMESGFNGIPLSRRAKAFTANEDGWTHQMNLIAKYLDQSG